MHILSIFVHKILWFAYIFAYICVFCAFILHVLHVEVYVMANFVLILCIFMKGYWWLKLSWWQFFLKILMWNCMRILKTNQVKRCWCLKHQIKQISKIAWEIIPHPMRQHIAKPKTTPTQQQQQKMFSRSIHHHSPHQRQCQSVECWFLRTTCAPFGNQMHCSISGRSNYPSQWAPAGQGFLCFTFGTVWA